MTDLLPTRGTAALAAPAAAVQGPVARAATKPACPADRADEASAAVAAKLCGARVEVLGKRTETTQRFVNPDGTVTEERALAPVRVRTGNTWQDVDLTLVAQPDGSVAPRVQGRHLWLSGGQPAAGAHEVVALGSGDGRSAVSWDGPLPRPVLAGSTATYPDVQPGLDLVIQAQTTGYEQFFVARTAAALHKAANLTLPVKTGALKMAADGAGGLTFRDTKGRAVGQASAPQMWDAAVGAVSQEHLHRAPVGLRTVALGAGRSEWKLTADPSFLRRSDLQFPVTIDPPASLPTAFDAFVQNDYTSDQSGADELKLGHVDDDGSRTARSYLRFATTGLWDARITTAQLRLWETHSYSCTAASWEAWRTDRADTSARWTAQPTAREKVGTSTATKGYNSSCADGYVYIEVGKALQYAADNHSADVTVMLRGTSETSSLSWKKFDSAEAGHPPVVSITYNAAPTAPTALAVAPCSAACGAGAATGSLRPTLSAKLADANAGQTLRAEFEVRNKATAATVATSGVLSGSTAWTNGSTAGWQVSATLASGTVYQWRVHAKDPYADGAWTGWTDLTVDTDKPGVPFVSAGIYLNDGQPHGGAGAPDTFTFTPASGTTDLAAFVYRLDTDAAATTLAATGAKSVTLSPRDGQRTLTVQAKDRAGNLSAANTYTFSAGNAALAQPLPGATVVKRTKLQIFTPVAGYTRTYYEYRRGPGGVTLPIPSANLMSASGAPITATAASPVAFSTLGGYAIWNATDTLGAVGGVVEVRARIYTATSTAPVYDTPWVRIAVDSSGDGASSDDVGPGDANLLTGDLSIDDTDVDEMGLSVARTASSRGTGDGWTPMPQKLTANQQQVSTDLTGFTVPSTSTAARSTALGQGDVTPVDSVEVTPAATGTSNDTYVALGGDTGGLRLGMLPGHTYRATAWIYVPSATTLAPSNVSNGLRIVGWYKNGTAYTPVPSAMAAYVDGWQELSVDMTVPAGSTEALFRLYNGNVAGSGKKVYWDNISVTEIVAPFGPSWNGGATGGPADGDYTTLSFPSASMARVNTVDGGWITFSRNADGTSFTPEPGNEGLVLSAPDANTYKVTDLDGSVSQFTKQGGVWTVTSSWTTESASTTKYVYDTTGGRLLLKRVINPVEPGVDDAGGCATATPVKGCQVLEYVYATSTTAGLSQTVFGDYTDRVTGVRLWSYDPAAGAESAVDVAHYAYDDLGRLREEWDPRITPALKTTYAYDTAGRVVKATPSGQLPWSMDYGDPDVDAAALRWDLDGNATDTSGAGRNGTATAVTWGEGNDPDNPGDRAAVLDGGSTDQITAAGTALSNTSSYTVSAWARITDKSVNRTIVSKDGTRTSGFFLNYVSSLDRWAFSRTTADNDSSSALRATSDVAPALGQWTHLTGVYDTAAGKMKLYVNGVLQSTTAATGGWNATGGYVIGRAKWAGAATNVWAGSIDDVRIYGSALSDAQVAALAGDQNSGRLLRVRRAALKQGTDNQTDGETATNLVYRVPLGKAAGGPYDLTGAAVATWGQSDLPTDATAVFDPDAPPARNSASPTVPGSAGYPFATVHYLNASGQEVNTAEPGGEVDTNEHDRFGNVVRTLDASDRALALGLTPDAADQLAALGLAGSDTATRAAALSTITKYSTDGVDEVETDGPIETMVLENGLADPDGDGPLPAVAAGSTMIGRSITTKAYDEGKPDGATYHLETTETEFGRIDGYPNADQRVTRYGYDAHDGGASGWTLGKYTTLTADAGAGGANLTADMVFDAAGRTLKTWGIDSTGTDAKARVITYYTAGANADDAACGNHPEWAGNACVTKEAGAITGGDSSRMPGTLPERRVTRYGRFGDAEVSTETADGKTRTTTTTYDAGGRPTTVQVTSDEGVALPAETTGYDPATGQAVSTTSAGGTTLSRTYDQLGRMSSYTDADGAKTVHQYDRLGNPAEVITPTGSTTYTYDRTIDPRGLMTSLADSTAGTFTARYSPDGQLTRLTYPGGVTRTDHLDSDEKPDARTYTRDSDGTVIYAESQVDNTAGQTVRHDYTGTSATYRYDRLGRLAEAQQTADDSDGCVTRTYAYDGRSNRTGRSVYTPAADGTCQQDTATTQETHAYDSADRLVDDGYAYDAFGRTTSLPGGLTDTYFVDDRVQSQAQGDARQTWTLDPAERTRSYATDTQVDGAWTNSATRVDHYGDDTDDPLWIVEDAANGAITRNVHGPDGDLAATTDAGGVNLQLENLHGDIAVTIGADLTDPQVYDYDEFGVAAPAQADVRYGWLGGKQRSGEAFGGVVQMGARLYDPVIGRFLQVDPQDGGNATSYDYCSGDPINCTDLDGKFWHSVWNGVKRGWHFVKNNPALVCSTLSFVTPPPFDAVFGAAAVGFSLYSGINNIRHHRWGAAAGDFLSAIPGAGSLGRGYRAFRAGRRAFRAGRTLQREAKYFRGARRAKRAYKSILHRHKHARWWHNAVKERWGRRDLRYAYPGSWGYTGCKYSSSCSHSRFSRWSRLF